MDCKVNLIHPQWPRDLRRGSVAARLLGLRFRIPQLAWMPVVSVVWCNIEVSAADRSPVQRSRAECGASECNSGNSCMRRTFSWGCRDMRKKIKNCPLFYIRTLVMDATAWYQISDIRTLVSNWNETADRLVRSGSGQRFIGLEPILGVSRQNIRKKMKRWMKNQHLVLWRGPCSTQRQARELISSPNLATGARLLSFNRTQTRVVIGLLTGRNTCEDIYT